MGSKYLVFRNCSLPFLNGYSIYGLCLTFWTNEFLGSYSNYKFIISFSMFNRMGFWRILCSQSNIEEDTQETKVFPMPICYVKSCTQQKCRIHNLINFYPRSLFLSSFFLSSLSFLWIGAQFPQEKFLSYARILTLYYYFLLMCILFP